MPITVERLEAEVRANALPAERELKSFIRKTEAALRQLDRMEANPEVNFKVEDFSKVRAKLRAELAKAQAQLNANPLEVKTRVDDRGFNLGIGRIVKGVLVAKGVLVGLEAISGTITFAALTAGAIQAASALSALAVAAIGLVSSMGPLVGLIATLPGLLGGAIAAFVGLSMALSPVGAALKAYTKSEEAATKASVAAGEKTEAASRRREAAARRVAQATQALADAEEQAAENIASALEQVQEAEQNLADAQREATDAQLELIEAREQAVENLSEMEEAQQRAILSEERARLNLERVRERTTELAEAEARANEEVARSAEGVARAEQNLADAHRDAQEAQEDLTRARERAIETLQDLQFQEERNALSERRARLRLAQAQERLTKINADGTATEAERQDAILDVEEAELSLRETIDRRLDDEKRLQEAMAKGVEGSDEVVAANKRIADANERISDSQDDLIDAQEDAAKATANLAKVQAGADLERREAALDLKEAELALADAIDERADGERELNKARQAGIEGSEIVLQAHRQVENANRNLIASNKALAEAHKGVADAQKRGARAIADAQDNITEALRAAADAAEDLGKAGAAGVNEFNEAMAKLSPTARDLVNTLLSYKPIIEELRRAVQDAAFPGFVDGLNAVRGTFRRLIPVIAGAAKVVGDFVRELGILVGSDVFGDRLVRIGESNNRVLGHFKDALLALINAFTIVVDAARPLTEWVAESIKKFSEWIEKTVEAKEASGDLAKAFDQVRESTRKWFEILGNVGGILIDILRAAFPLGDELASSMENLTQKTKDWTGSVEGQQRMKEIFAEFRPLIREIVGLVGDLMRAFGGVAFNNIQDATNTIKVMRDVWVPAFEAIAEKFGGRLGTTIAETIGKMALAFAAMPVSAIETFFVVLGKIADLIVVISQTDFGGKLLGIASAMTGVGMAASVLGVFLKPLGGIISTISGALGNLLLKIPAIGKLSTALKGLSLVGGLSLGAVVLAVVGLAVAIYKNWDTIMEKTEGLRMFLREKLQEVADFFKEKWEDIKRFTDENWLAIETAIKTFTENIKRDIDRFAGFVKELWKAFGDELGNITRIVWNFIKDIIDGALKIIRGIIELVLGVITGDWDKAWTGIKNILAGIWDIMWSIIKTSFGLIREVIEGALSGLRTAWDAAWEGMAGVVANIWDRISDIVRGGVRILGNVIAGFLRGVAEVADVIPGADGIARGLRGVADSADSWGERGGPEGKLVSGGPNVGTNGMGYARGGRVPGQGNHDTVPALLTPGEFVVRKGAVRAVGLDALEELNAQGFAEGGLVGTVGGWISSGVQAARGLAASGLGAIWPKVPVADNLMGIPAAAINWVRDTVLDAIAGKAEEEAGKQEAARQAAAAASAPGGGPAGAIGNEKVGNGWRAITNYLDSVGHDYTVTSTLRPGAITSSGNLSNHALGKAVDLVSGNMMGTFNVLLNIASSLSELFYDPAGFSIKNGARANFTVGGHSDHVHAATFDSRNFLEPGMNMAFNGTGSREWLTPDSALLKGFQQLSHSIEQSYLSQATSGIDSARNSMPSEFREYFDAKLNELRYPGISPNTRIVVNQEINAGFVGDVAPLQVRGTMRQAGDELVDELIRTLGAN